MKVLLVSTYELGRQPVHLASPAATLQREGHEVRAVDLAAEELSETSLDWADCLAVSVPMHTAKRLADDLSAAVRSTRPKLPIAHYGLYAGVGHVQGGPVDVAIEGEYESGLIEWVGNLRRTMAGESRVLRHIGRSDFSIPERSGLPDLENYARLEHNGESVLAGTVEASHGCRHRCRHCPIPVIYDGRMRTVPQELVLRDIDQLVSAGARHITFGDPDFLNAPPHSLSILEQAHAKHPEITFDVTVKVEHILEHESIWPTLAGQNLLFVVSAFESVDETTLEILDKGHTVSDMSRAVETLRAAGIHARPTWLPFLPWTETGHITSLLRFISDHRLSGATDPVQLSIKLLIPQGSLLESHPAVIPHLDGYDPGALTWQWTFVEPEVEVLQKELAAIAADGSDCGREVTATLRDIWDTVGRLTGTDLGQIPAADEPVPRLTESWFCCAEPTPAQAVSLQVGRREPFN